MLNPQPWINIDPAVAVSNRILRVGSLIPVISICSLKKSYIFISFDICFISTRMWKAVKSWIGNKVSLHTHHISNILLFSLSMNNYVYQTGIRLIWLAMIWNLWLFRNSILFKGRVFSFEKCLNSIKRMSWRWLSSYSNNSSCTFSCGILSL